MNETLEKWLEKIKEEINNNTLTLKKSDSNEYLFYIQKQLATMNEIKLKEIELNYLNKNDINAVHTGPYKFPNTSQTMLL